LGRYDDMSGDATHEVRLLNLPLKLLEQGREHHDEVMREFAMLALDENLSTDHVPSRMLELIDVLGRRYAASAARPDAEVDAALARGDTTIDLVYHVPAHVAEATQQLEKLMTEADEFCRQQKMLALERPPHVVEFTRWYLDEFRRQVAGEPPRPWDGPLTV
jgi:cation transport regulator ChaC